MTHTSQSGSNVPPRADSPQAAGRLVFDVSSLARWVGVPGGIVRVEHELLKAFRSQQPDIVPAVFDPVLGCYRTIRDEWRDVILGESGAVRLSDGPAIPGQEWQRWLRHPGNALIALNAWRVGASNRWLATAIDRVERLASHLPHDSVRFFAPDGSRFSYVPARLALGDPLAVSPRDTVLTVGYDWLRKSPAHVRKLKSGGTRYVVTCYDMIPALFPEFYAPAEVEGFRTFWRSTLPLADVVLTISERTRIDLVEWAAREGVAVGNTQPVTLGCSLGAPDSPVESALAPGLTANQFILMVGTIEPRKGHSLMLRVWRALLERGIPQRLGFVLVFAGRTGWMSSEVVRDIRQMTGQHFVHLEDVWDARLERLYRDCAFCVMPSKYEGYGLPVIEAFAHGKTVITSTGGSLPEVAGNLAPCIDAADAAAWQALIEEWMASPAAREPYEQRIHSTFRRPTWSEAAASFWNAAHDGA